MQYHVKLTNQKKPVTLDFTGIILLSQVSNVLFFVRANFRKLGNMKMSPNKFTTLKRHIRIILFQGCLKRPG